MAFLDRKKTYSFNPDTEAFGETSKKWYKFQSFHLGIIKCFFHFYPPLKSKDTPPPSRFNCREGVLPLIQQAPPQPPGACCCCVPAGVGSVPAVGSSLTINRTWKPTLPLPRAGHSTPEQRPDGGRKLKCQCSHHASSLGRGQGAGHAKLSEFNGPKLHDI